MPRHPPALDPERLRTLLTAARGDGDTAGSVPSVPMVEPRSGWVPTTAPPDADLGWLEEDLTALDASDLRRRGDDEDEDDGDASRRAGSRASTDGRGNASRLPRAGRHRPGPKVLTLPAAFRGAQLRVSWRAVVAFVIVLVMAGLVLTVRVARAEQAAAPQVVGGGTGLVGRADPAPAAFATTPTGAGTATATRARASPATATPASGATAGGTAGGMAGGAVVVDVVGQVARPGVVTVPAGARVVDVLAAVGGALPGAEVQRLNLARVVADGEQIFVPKPGETPPASIPAAPNATGGAASGAGGGSGPSALVDLNTADAAALDGLPGVGPILAQRILDWRKEHGRFSTVDELGEVTGIGDKLLEQVRPKVRV